MNTWHSRATIVATVLFLASVMLPGCKNSDSAPGGNGSSKSGAAKSDAGASAHSIIGVTLSPDIGLPLKAGSLTKLSVEVEYLLPPKGGRIGVIVQDGGDKPVASVLKDVPGGVGKLATELEFKVAPTTKTVRVSVPLYVMGETTSKEIVDKEYSVER